MTGPVLYLRTRRVGGALAAACGGLAAAWVWQSVTTDGPRADPSAVVLTVILLVCATTGTLVPPDADLERTAALRWAWWRAVHLLLAAGIVIALVAATLLTRVRFGPLDVVVRDTAGLLGLAALAAVTLGARLAWLPPLGWGLLAVAVRFVDPGGTGRRPVLEWPVQAGNDVPAALTATALAVIGTVAYAARGPR